MGLCLQFPLTTILSLNLFSIFLLPGLNFKWTPNFHFSFHAHRYVHGCNANFKIPRSHSCGWEVRYGNTFLFHCISNFCLLDDTSAFLVFRFFFSFLSLARKLLWRPCIVSFWMGIDRKSKTRKIVLLICSACFTVYTVKSFELKYVTLKGTKMLNFFVIILETNTVRRWKTLCWILCRHSFLKRNMYHRNSLTSCCRTLWTRTE